MNIQWFPGHMAKTRRIIGENLKLVDVVIEMLDARIPISSKNPVIDDIIGNKPKLSVLNKADLSDESKNKIWSNWFEKNNRYCLFINSINGKGMPQVKNKLKEMMHEKIENQKNKGRRFTPIRVMVLGIPNVGKSTFINRLSKKAVTITGDRPGVTKSKQWIRIDNELELLDMPGILWPKFEDENVGLNLAWTGAIKDDVIDKVEVTARLFERLVEIYPEQTKERYKLEDLNGTGYDILKNVGKKRGCIIAGGEIDYPRISSIVLDELRGKMIGNITFETPDD